MNVSNIVNHIKHRVGTHIIEKHGEKFIVEAINLAYAKMNLKYELVQNVFNPDYSTYDVDGNIHKSLPSDFVSVYHIHPQNYEYKNIADWDTEKYSYIWTINRKYIFFYPVSASFSPIVEYYTSGAELVYRDPGAGQSLTPEWESHFHLALVYATSIYLSNDYPLIQHDIAALSEMESLMSTSKERQQRATPRFTPMLDARRKGNAGKYDGAL